MHSTTATTTDPIVCRCLQVSQSQIQDAIAVYGCETVREVTQASDAGGGCTVCHCRIRQMIEEARQKIRNEETLRI